MDANIVITIVIVIIHYCPLVAMLIELSFAGINAYIVFVIIIAQGVDTNIVTL